jgi:PAS domain S-box-containing protein
MHLQGAKKSEQMIQPLELESPGEEKREQLQMVLDSATSVSIITGNADGLITVFSAGAENMFGYSAEEMVGKQTLAILQLEAAVNARESKPPTESEKAVQGFEAFMNKLCNGEPQEGEWTYVRKDGSHLAINLAAVGLRDGSGAVSGFVMVAMDPSAGKKAEAAARGSDEHFRLIVEASEDYALIMLDPTGQVMSWNIGAERIKGYKAAEIIGRHFSTFYSPEDIEALRPAIGLRIAAEQGRHSEEGWRLRKDGSRFIADVVIAPIHDDAGKLRGFAKVVHDITARKKVEERSQIAMETLADEIAERKKVEADLQLAKERAEAANLSKSDFLASMSHEIRTPMNGIIGMTELVLDTELTREQREFMGMVKSSADSLLSLINDILDFSKIEAGKLDFETIDFMLRDSLDDTTKALAFRARQKGLALACRILPEVPDGLKGDPTRLRQIMVNLVGNAIKFTEKGEVVVEVASQEETEDEVVLHFAVRDTGTGIPLERQQSIFEAFIQADSSTTRQYGGTGLGLSISSRLVKLMGGKIWVESKVGQGSTFHFTVRLPMQEISSRKYGPVDVEMLRDLPLLIVDSNATSRRILAEMALAWQMKPAVAESGDEALALLQQANTLGTPFGLVLVDAQIPGLDRFGFAERLKQEPTAEGLPIIMLTSDGLRGDAARCRELGINAYLTKPVKRSDLLQAIRGALGSQAADDQNPPVLTVHSLRENRKRLGILLVEDNRVNEALAVRLLEQRGHHVTVARNGRAAQDALAQQTPDLILMDVQMPEMDGFEATAAIREGERKSGRHVPIIAMTAHTMAGDKERCLEAGMDGYVSKPICPDELFSVVEQVLAKP